VGHVVPYSRRETPWGGAGRVRWGEEDEEPSRGEARLTGLSPGAARRRSRGGLRRPKTIELPDFDSSNEESAGSADEGGGARGALLPPIGWKSMRNAGR
jgi:hypothetical protein